MANASRRSSITLGAAPVFADIDPRTFNLDPGAARAVAARCERLRALIPVHFAGQSCDLTALGAFARARGIPVIEDAAHALPATFDGRTIGTLSEVTVFSFYATETIATGEGGMVVSRDPALLRWVRTMRLHRLNCDVFDRYTSTAPKWYYEVVAPGFKYNMPTRLQRSESTSCARRGGSWSDAARSPDATIVN